MIGGAKFMGILWRLTMRWKLGLIVMAATALWLGAGTTQTAPSTQPTATQAAPAPQAPSTYSDAKYGFTLHVPELGLGTSAPGLVMIRGPVINGFASNQNILVQPLTSKADYDKSSEEQFKAHNVTVNSRKPLKVSGRDAELLDYEAVVNGQACHFLQLAVFDGDHLVTVTCTSSKETFELYETEFRKSLDSFKLAEK